MSPTEHELRSALHHGEGDGPDVDQLIAGGRARRQQRRVRMGATAGAVAFVAAAATGATLLIGHDAGHGPSAAGADKRAASQASSAGAAAGGGRALPTPQRGAASSAVGCPASLPRQLLPGGGSPGQFGSGGPLFAQPVRSIVVCAYGPKDLALDHPLTEQPGRIVLDGASARQLADSLNNAATARAPCPTVKSASIREFALIGVAAGGGVLRTVTLELSRPTCQSMITNGTAIRYGWNPPAGLDTVLDRLRPYVGPARTGVGGPPS